MIEGPGDVAVTVRDCERASRTIGAAIRSLDLDPGAFDLEVESPGADRPLTREVDFERFRGQQVTVTLREAREGRRNFTGALIGFVAVPGSPKSFASGGGGDVTLHVLDTPEPETFRAADVKEVRLHPDLKSRPSERPEQGGPRR
jgi:ribosome maturation factor RimP